MIDFEKIKGKYTALQDIKETENMQLALDKIRKEIIPLIEKIFKAEEKVFRKYVARCFGLMLINLLIMGVIICTR